MITSIRVKPCDFGLSICRSSKEDNLTIVIGSDKLEFVLSPEKKTHKQRLEEEISKFYGEIFWQLPTEDKIKVRCLDKNRDLQNWRKDVGEVIKQFFDSIKVQPIGRRSVVDNEILKKKGNASVLHKKENGRIVLVGFKDDVNKLRQSIVNMFDEEAVERRTLKVRRYEAYIVHYSDIADSFVDATVEVDIDKSEISISGPPCENEVTVGLLLDQLTIINTFKNMAFSGGRMTLLRSERIRDRILRTENKLNLYYETEESPDCLSLTLYTLDDDGKDKFISFVHTRIIEEEVIYSEQHVVNDVVVACESIERNYNGETCIQVKLEYRAITVTAFKTDIESVLTDLSNILCIEPEFDVLDLFKPATFKFLMEKIDEIENFVHKQDCEVWKNNDLSAFYLKGREKSIENVRDEIGEMISKIVFHHIQFQTHCTDLEVMDKLVDAECRKTGCKFNRDPEKITETIRNIVVHNGDITMLDVDVIAVSSNQRLKMLSGLSKIVLKKGGKQIQEECDAHVKKEGPVDRGDVFICSGGKLTCLAIAHVVTGQMDSSKDITKLEQAVVRCLLRIEFQKFKSVAFPALFTNVFRCRTDTSVKTIVEAINMYFDDNPKSDIHTIILCDKETERTLTFLNAVKTTKWQSKVLLDHNIEREFLDTYMVTSPGSSFQPFQPLEEGFLTPQRIGNLVIHAYLDDITNVKVDAVVSSDNNNLDMMKGRGIEKFDIMMTNKGPDKMGCHSVIHVDICAVRKSTEPVKDLENRLFEVLIRADKAKLGTVAFPPLGTGAIFSNTSDYGLSMFRVLERTRKKKWNFLREVHLVMHDIASLRKLHDCLRRCFLGSGDIWMPSPQGVTEHAYIISGTTEEAVNKSIEQIKKHCKRSQSGGI